MFRRSKPLPLKSSPPLRVTLIALGAAIGLFVHQLHGSASSHAIAQQPEGTTSRATDATRSDAVVKDEKDANTSEHIIESMSSRQRKFEKLRFVWKETVQVFKSPMAEQVVKEIAEAETEEQQAYAKTMWAVTPDNDITYELQELLIFDGERVRFEREGVRPADRYPTRQLKPFTEISAFDGKVSTRYHLSGMRGGENGRAIVAGKNNVIAFEYMNARPIILAYRGLDWVESRERADMFNKSDVSTDIIGGNTCVVLGRGNAGFNHIHGVAIWIDPSRDNHVVRTRHMNQGYISAQLDIYYKEDEHFGWVPHMWKCTLYYGDGTLERIWKARVVEYALNPDLPADTFVVPLAAGTQVSDQTTGTTYYVGSDDN